MNRTARTGSRLFFIEFLIVLFFFLIISTVCLRLFVRAHTITKRSEILSEAQTTAASVAAVIETGHITPEDAASFFPDASVTEDGFFLLYDHSFSACSADQAVYTMNVTLEQEDHDTSASVVIENADHETIYELSVSYHEPLTREEALQ